MNPFDGDQFDPLNLSLFEASPDPDDINGVDPTFANLHYATYAGAPTVQEQVIVSFYGGETGDDGDGPRFELDEPIGNVVFADPSAPVTPAVLPQEILIA